MSLTLVIYISNVCFPLMVFVKRTWAENKGSRALLVGEISVQL